MSTETNYTIQDYLFGSVNMDIPSEAVVKICLDRDVEVDALATDVEKSTRDLLNADLLVWMVTGVSRRSGVSDTDNGWTHSDNGYTLNESDKKMFLKMANAIYEENGESTIGKTTFKFQSHGIKRADFSIDGIPQPHIVQ